MIEERPKRNGGKEILNKHDEQENEESLLLPRINVPHEQRVTFVADGKQ